MFPHMRSGCTVIRTNYMCIKIFVSCKFFSWVAAKGDAGGKIRDVDFLCVGEPENEIKIVENSNDDHEK